MASRRVCDSGLWCDATLCVAPPFIPLPWQKERKNKEKKKERKKKDRKKRSILSLPGWPRGHRSTPFASFLASHPRTSFLALFPHTLSLSLFLSKFRATRWRWMNGWMDRSIDRSHSTYSRPIREEDPRERAGGALSRNVDHGD